MSARARGAPVRAPLHTAGKRIVNADLLDVSKNENGEIERTRQIQADAMRILYKSINQEVIPNLPTWAKSSVRNLITGLEKALEPLGSEYIHHGLLTASEHSIKAPKDNSSDEDFPLTEYDGK